MGDALRTVRQGLAVQEQKKIRKLYCRIEEYTVRKDHLDCSSALKLGVSNFNAVF